MPLPRVVCPECGAGLKSPTGFNPGQTVNCPKCETPFTVEEPQAAAPVTAKKPVRAVAALDDDDEDDDRPRKKRRRDDDDDDRPRKGKKKAGGYKNSPLRFVVLGVLLVALGVMVYLLVLKKKKESDTNADPAPAANTDDDLAKPTQPGGGPRPPVDRSRAMTDMKQVMLAMHNHLGQKNAFPAAAICDSSGKPLLSWRVALLPYLEQQAMHSQFNLNEPWDSETNKKHIKYMPSSYRGTVASTDGTTSFKVFVGGGSGFDLAKGKRIDAFGDGTSNTIAVVEAGIPVPWTKPEDIPFTTNSSLREVTPPGGGSGPILTGMFDGAVRWVNWSRVTPKSRTGAITASGGELLDINWDQ